MESNHELLKKSMFKNIKPFLTATIAAEQADEIYQETLLKLKILIFGLEFRGNQAVEQHMKTVILPAVALYKILQKHSFSQEDAKDVIARYTSEEAEKTAKVYRFFGKIPFFYRIFLFAFKRVMASSYPKEGWTIDWLEREKDRAVFHMKSCLYLEIFTEQGCKELTPLFCHLDEINYKHMSKKVRFERTKTLAADCDCCDFAFYKQK